MTPEYLRWNYSRMGYEVRLRIGRDQERRIIATMNRLGVNMWHAPDRMDRTMGIDCIFEPTPLVPCLATARADQWGALKIRVTGRDVPCVLREGQALTETARDIRSNADFMMVINRSGFKHWYKMKQVKVLALAADDYYIGVKTQEWITMSEPELERWQLKRHDDPHSGHRKLNCFIKATALDLKARFYILPEWEEGVEHEGME